MQSYYIQEVGEGRIDGEDIAKVRERIEELKIKLPDFFLNNFYHVDTYMNERIIRLQGYMTATGYQRWCPPRMLEIFEADVAPRMMEVTFNEWEMVVMITISVDIVNPKKGQTL